TVQCDESNIVTRIQLKTKGIQGTLPLKPEPDLSGLTRLQTLSTQEAYLENNPFSPWEMTMDKQKTGLAIHICYKHTMTLLVLLIVCLYYQIS
ncbi:unnamed protein product, partial [Brassica oleracea var. botrytis]